MNILMLRPQIELGGVTSHIKLLTRGLREAGHQVRAAAAGGILAHSMREVGISVHPFPLYPSTPVHLIRSAIQLRRFVRHVQIDLLHSHHRFTTIVGRVVQQMTGVPLIATVHEFKTDGRVTGPVWARNIIITPSQALKEHLVAFYGAAGKDIYVIPHAIEPARASGPERHVPAVPADAAGPVSVGYIGRLAPEKGVSFFLESIPLIARRWPDARCIIAGDGPDARRLWRRAERLGLNPARIFLGARADVDALLETLDVVVIPSRSESFSMVALEAMRAARPVVAAAVGGLPEVVRDGETGLLVNSASSAALAEAVGKLLADPALRRRLGARGREVVKEEHSPTLMVGRTLDAYQAARDACRRS